MTITQYQRLNVFQRLCYPQDLVHPVWAIIMRIVLDIFSLCLFELYCSTQKKHISLEDRTYTCYLGNTGKAKGLFSSMEDFKQQYDFVQSLTFMEQWYFKSLSGEWKYQLTLPPFFV